MLFRKTNLARLISTKGRRQPLFMHFSMKANGLILSESYLEFSGNTILDMHRKVGRMATQPFTVSFYFEGRLVNWTLDTLVSMSARPPILIEYAYSEEVKKDPALLEKLALVNEGVIEGGFGGAILRTEEHVLSNRTLLQNCLTLHRHAVSMPPDEFQRRSIHEFTADEATSLGRLLEFTDEKDIPSNCVWHLMGRRALMANLSEEITMDIPIQWDASHVA